MLTIQLQTERRVQMLDITARVEEAVRSAGVREGVCVLWSEHTTAALTVNENADPDVARDIERWLDERVPAGAEYRHLEGNADAHIKTALVGPGLTLIVSDGGLQLGRWQGVFLCEFDGPRPRRLGMQLIASP
jgi:secondary thiamine-phosphate synthase enzyme